MAMLRAVVTPIERCLIRVSFCSNRPLHRGPCSARRFASRSFYSSKIRGISNSARGETTQAVIGCCSGSRRLLIPEFLDSITRARRQGLRGPMLLLPNAARMPETAGLWWSMDLSTIIALLLAAAVVAVVVIALYFFAPRPPKR
jgi:hypothetical protein